MSRRAIGLVPIGLFLVALACSGNKTTTPPPPPTVPPKPPSGLYAVRTSTTAIKVRWRDNSDTETGFRVERKAPDEAFAAIDTVAPNLNSYDDRSVTEGLRYAYRVHAYRFEANSQTSNEISVLATSKAPPFPPSSPSPPDGTRDLGELDPVSLSWYGQDPQQAALTYDVYFGPTLSGLERVSSGQTDTTYVVNGPFTRNSHYFWRVVANDLTGVSAPSPVWGFNTAVDRDTIPGGLFIMGDTLQYLNGNPERPNPLWHPGNPVETQRTDMDRYLVTNQQYADFLNQQLNARRLWLNQSRVYDEGQERLWMVLSPADTDCDITFSVGDSSFVVDEGRDNFPVVQVTWYGASAYAQFYGRRLPSEAEWEKAARGTNDDVLGSRRFPAGEDTITIGLGYPYPWGGWSGPGDLNRGNYRGSGDPYENEGRVRTTPVGFYDGTAQRGYQTGNGSSPYGLADMSGNVWEWCADWFGDYQTPHSPPTAGRFKVIRGGSFDQLYSSSTTWNRSSLSVESNDRAVGFRTVN